MVSDLLRRITPSAKPKADSKLMIGYAGEADIKALFELLGMVAKADGSVSPKEIQEVERVMTYHIATDQKEFAKGCFRSGRDADVTKGMITKRAFQLYGVVTDRWLEPVQVLDILLRLALIDGRFDPNEEYIIDSVRQTLGFHKRSYWILRDTLAARWGVYIPREGASFATNVSEHEADHGKEAPPPKSRKYSREEALSTLGLKEGATEEEIKVAHRALVKQFHPDLAEGKQVSEEQMKQTVLRFCEVQSAYEALVNS